MMDEHALEDENKPFDAEVAQEEDGLPDPDEKLMLDQGNGRVWLVKVCRICLSNVTS
jgi:transcription initiation factor TFIIF subunit beta